MAWPLGKPPRDFRGRSLRRDRHNEGFTLLPHSNIPCPNREIGHVRLGESLLELEQSKILPLVQHLEISVHLMIKGEEFLDTIAASR
jgi:hypothetical protein